MMSITLNLSEKLVLELISFNNHISRKQLASVSDLSQASITKITKLLIDHQFIKEGNRVSQGMGRKEVLLYTNPDKFRFLGIDIGGVYIRLAIADNDLNIHYRSEILIESLAGEADKAEVLIREMDLLLERSGLKRTSIDAIGIGITGIIDIHSTTILNIPNRNDWDNVSPIEALEKAYGCPVFLEEGGRTMALAEMKFGKAKNFKDFIVVHVGYGIAAGVIINGQILRGFNNTAGLLGHITADPNGSVCLCGNYGCLENIITFPMLEGEYYRQNNHYPNLVAAYEQKDKDALNTCIKAGTAFGIALSNVINLFNPQAVLIGGKMFDQMPLLFEETKRTIILRANRFSTISLKTERSSFGDNEGIIGALTLAKTKLIEQL
jgi:N-acetylglucosamine repressor